MRVQIHVALGWLGLACLGAGCAPQDGAGPLVPVFPPEDLTFHVGPYIGHTTQTSVAIGWETLEPGDTRVEWGSSEALGRLAEGPAGSMHQVRIEGLEPGRRYHYRACTGTNCTRTLSFDTAPPSGVPFTFGVYADCQDRPEVHRRVVEQLVAGGAWLAVVAGDTVSHGGVREQYKERYFDPARVFAQVRPRYAAVGNHDRKDVEVEAFRDYNIFPEDPDVPQAETSYSFTYGDAFFLVFDNTLDHYDFFFPLAEGNEPPLWRWLQRQAGSPEARQARFRFAFAHYPAHSNCYPEGHVYGMPESAVRAHVLPLLLQHGFHAYFNGHQHCYERFDFDGLLAITTGGGGGGLEDEADCDDGLPEARFHRCVHHATLVELGPDGVRVRAVDIDGELIEEFTVPE
jgi:hypothetical protein